jgi:hypothetical protein
MKIAWCLQHCTDPLVCSFARGVLQQINNLRNGTTHFTALYFGERMLTLAQRIKYNYPQNILSWFGNKPTHIIKVGQAVEGTQKRMRESSICYRSLHHITQ